MRIEQNFIADIKNIVQGARKQAYAAINFYMLEAYWKVGERIVQEEQRGKHKAEYGTFLILELSKRLTSELGKGFSEINLKSFRLFYIVFSGIEKGRQCLPFSQKDENQQNKKSDVVKDFSELIDNLQLRKELTWSHYQLIMRVDNPIAREYYMNEAANHNWSVRTLKRNINTLYYERILSSINKNEALTKSGLLEKQSPADFIKDPYIFEFVNIPQPYHSNEQYWKLP